MDADDFAAWIKNQRHPDGKVWTGSDVARALGCGRSSVYLWLRNGAPRYIGLACHAVSRGLGMWQPPLAAKTKGERRPLSKLDDDSIPWRKKEPA